MWFYFFTPRGSQRRMVKPHCSLQITMSVVWAIAVLQVPFAMPCMETWRTCCHSKLRTYHPSAAQPVPWCLVVERFLVSRDLTKSSILPWKLEHGNIWARFHATKLGRKKSALLKFNVKNAMEHCFVWSRLSLVSRVLAGALHWARKLPQICVRSLARTEQKQGSNRQRMATALSFRG